MFLPRSSTKLTLHHNKYPPSSSFLSPAHRYNQRSYSASSSYLSEKPTFHSNNNLREQIRLESFKKSVMAESKLNKTNLRKATLKLNSYENMEKYERGDEKKDYGRQSALQRQNEQLRKQRNEDLVLISRQNELILSLEKELSAASNTPPNCNCFLLQEYQAKLQKYQIKNEHLQQELNEYKRQLRQLIFRQEEMKMKMLQCEQKHKEEIKRSRKLQELLDDKKENRGNESRMRENRGEVGEKSLLVKNGRVDEKRRDFGMISPSRKIEIKDSYGSGNTGNKDLQRYYEYLGKLRNRQIDNIDDLLKQ